MKICSKCKIEKPLNEFRVRLASIDKLQPICRICQNEKDNKYYLLNKTRRIKTVRSRTVKIQSELNAFKTGVGCKDCGAKNLKGWQYDFDHLHSKVEGVSRMLSHSREKIWTEVGKCDVVCSNCHRVRSHVRKHGTKDPVVPKKAQKVPVLRRMWDKLLEFKNQPCKDCNGIFHFSAMDCDHRDQTTKLGEPSNMARNGPERVFLEELQKCDVVCSNCHRNRTYVA